MRKKALAFLMTLTLTVCCLPVSAGAAGTLSNFIRKNAYTAGQFTDVADQWFAPYVQSVYEYGLMNGKSSTTFAPDSDLTIAEAIKLASCLNSIFSTGSCEFGSGDTWYAPYVGYAIRHGVVSMIYADYTAVATRADFAYILSNALPEEALAVKNTIDDGAIPDVVASSDYGAAVYKLYRAGVMTGSDTRGSFLPGSSIKRSEVAAVVARMAIPAERISITLTVSKLTSTEIAATCAPAVFYIEAKDLSGASIRSGSGFFISDSGLALTNYSIVKGAASAFIRTADGRTYDVKGVCDYSDTNNMALLQIDGGFPYLNLGNSDSVVAGDTIYAIGSPFGLVSTISEGLISNVARQIGDIAYIQISAAISLGSSGGPLINSSGKVIGIAALIHKDAQNINYAVPINLAGAMKTAQLRTLRDVNFPETTYSKYYPVPDFGAYSGVPLYDSDYDGQYQIQQYIYKMDGSADPSGSVPGYFDLLDKFGFAYTGDTRIDFVDYAVFGNESYNLVVAAALMEFEGSVYFQLVIMKAE